MADTVRIPTDRYTYGEYLQWVGDDRCELIDGEVHFFEGSPSTAHQTALLHIAVAILNHRPPHAWEAYIAPFDVRLPDADEPDGDVRTVVQPDITVFRDTSKLDDAGARGAPDLAVEVLMPETERRDRVLKMELYARHRVREYWIVDPIAKTVEVRLLNTNGKWSMPTMHGPPGHLRIAVLEGLEIDLTTVFAY